MKLLEDVFLEDSIEIKTTPERIFNFLTNLVDDESYRTWHPTDHVALSWIKGKPWKEGSIVCAQEYIHGKMHKLKFRITKIIPNKIIEYAPCFWLYRIYFPKNTFEMVREGEICTFTAKGHLRVGRLVKKFARNKLEFGIRSIKQHMKEEGKNLKKILEHKNL